VALDVDTTSFLLWIPLTLPAVVAVLNALQLLRLSRGRDRPPTAVSTSPSSLGTPPGPPAAPSSLRLKVASWLRRHLLEVALAALLVAIAAYVRQVSPGTFLDLPSRSGVPGHPYQWLTYFRRFQMESAQVLGFVVALLAASLGLACFAVSWVRRDAQAARTGLLTTGVGMLALWQLAMLKMVPVPPATPFAMGAVTILGWCFAYRPSASWDLFGPLSSRWGEIALAAIAILVTIAARTFFLSRHPYGIEGDELKWTVEVVRSTLDGEYFGGADYHLSSLPVSFFMEAAFIRLFGPGFLSARLAAVVFSIAGSLAFYALVRATIGPRVAWLATFLLGISLLDVSASRLANVESLVKFWPLAALLMLAVALDRRRTSLFLAAGALVALGLLTYDTVAPLFVVGSLLLVYDLVRLKVPRPDAIRFGAAYLAPQLAVSPAVTAYWAGRLPYYELGQRGLGAAPLQDLLVRAQNLVQSLFSATAADFLYNRGGPLFESLLVPWLAAGLILALVLWRKARTLWVLVFALLFFIPVPILAASPMSRVLYPGLPAAYVLMAMALAAAYGELARLFGALLRPVLITLAAIVLLQLALLHQYISFNEVYDADDRQIRRELYDLAAAVQDSGSTGIFPYLTGAADPIENEYDYAVWLGMRSRVRRADDIGERLLVPAGSLLAALSERTPTEEGVTFVWDVWNIVARKTRDQLLATVLRCYPGAERVAGIFFDQYRLSSEILRTPLCGSAEVTLQSASEPALGTDDFVLLWTARGAPVSLIELTCGRRIQELQILQAEAMTGPGWESETRHGPGYQGAGFLADRGEGSEATLVVDLPVPNDYYVWIRYLRREVDPYPAVLTFGGRQVNFASSMGPLSVWAWQRMGPYHVDSGSVPLTLRRPYNGPDNKFVALFFDAIVLTVSPDFDPRTDDPFLTVLTRTVPLSAPANEGSLRVELGPGEYACWVRLIDDGRLLDPYGAVGVRSAPFAFEILPAP
jgi:hypothetical protein